MNQHFMLAMMYLVMGLFLACAYVLQRRLKGVDALSRMLWTFGAGFGAGAVMDQTMQGLLEVCWARGGHSVKFLFLGFFLFFLLFTGFAWARSKSREKRSILALIFLVDLGLMVAFLIMW